MFHKEFPTSICILVITLSSVISRKYDLDQESHRLYREGFQSVLQRFRRTPDYLRILSEKQNELDTRIGDISENIKIFYMNEIGKRVTQLIGAGKEEETTTTSPSFYFRGQARKQNQDEELELNDTQRSGVQRLDTYRKLNSTLTLTERNSFRDLGYEYAGRMIHTLIGSLDPVEGGAAKSTQAPHEGTDTVATEHVSVHEVTRTTVSTHATMPEELESTVAPPHDKYRHRARARVVSRNRHSNSLTEPAE